VVANIDNEWNRIMGNPDNVIMSDELESRVDLSEFYPKLDDDIRLDPSCEFVFSDYTITGTLLCFAATIEDGKSSYTFSTPSVDACKLLNVSPLESYRVYTASDDKELMKADVTPTANVDVLIQWQESANSVVTLTFGAWAK